MLPPASPTQIPTKTTTKTDAERFIAGIFAEAIAPDPRRTVSEWADAERIVDDDSPYPGQWQTQRVPYLREPMDKATLSDPCRRVSFVGSAQIAKTQLILNVLGQIIHETPCRVLAVLPSIEESADWAKDKLDPMISATAPLRRRVRSIVQRSAKGSTTRRKTFPGGLIQLAGANSSKGLQSRTRRVVVFDEISEFPFDVDKRGDPVAMAEARTTAWTRRGYKIVAVSTPGLKGACRITNRWDDSSRGQFHVSCPHCQHSQVLAFPNLRWDAGRPETAEYHCSGCGAAIKHGQKAAMLAAGKWVHEKPDLLSIHAGYKLNALYSPFVDWAHIAAQYEASRNDPLLDKVFTQQVLGEAYEARHDTVAHQVLWERRTAWKTGTIPPGVLFLMGATDVQGDRLEWGVYGFDRYMGQWWIDGGIIPGATDQAEVWERHNEVLTRKWQDAWGRHWPARAWGIDSGYNTNHVYSYGRRHAARRDPQVYVLKGAAKWGEPPLGPARPAEITFDGRRIGTVSFRSVGTWDIKSEISGALHLLARGPDESGLWPKGAMRFPDRVDLAFFEQLTAEALNTRSSRSGYDVREWVKVRARNEQLDIAVYARALALDWTNGFTEQHWQNLVAARVGADQDLFTALPEHPVKAPIDPPPGVVPAAMPPVVAASAIATGRNIAGPGRSLR
jgi:phage terminase large subunit GpA-like protein